MTPTERAEAAATIESFLDGSSGRYDWDDLISIPRSDKTFALVGRYCLVTSDLYPATNSWCSDEGAARLREFAALLRSSAGNQEIAAFVEKEHAKL